MPTGRSSVPPVFSRRSLPPSLLQGTHCRWPEQRHQYPAVEPVTSPPPLSPRSPPQKSCIWQPHGHPRAQLVSSLLHHHTSPSLRLLPGRTRVKDTPLLFWLLSAKCSRGIFARGSKTFWHLCPQLSLLVLCLSSLSSTSLLLSPMAAPSIYHTGIELRRHACRRLSPVHDCFWGCTSERSRHYPGWLELGTFQLLSVGFRDPGTPCRRCILQQAFLGHSVDETRCPHDQPKSAPASRIWRLFLEASLLVMLSCL